MRIAEINMTDVGSTGRIMLQIAQCARERGHEVKTFSPVPFSLRNRSKMEPQKEILGHTYYGDYWTRGIHSILGYGLGLNGLCSVHATAELIRQLKEFSPDVLHLHNLHWWCINLPMLFRYIKKDRIRVVWTLHDCWSFTGHCPHFEYTGCEKWRTGCYSCPRYRDYPYSKVDNSRMMYSLKKKWFTGVENMMLVTPSKWLADLAKQSFLKEYPVKVIHNGIDLSIFKPTPSDFREKYRCKNKTILLGVADSWSVKKGLDTFIELSKRLNEEYQIILVGTNDEVDAKLPNNIISIHRTYNQEELAKIYTAADLFVNPTREEALGLVNLEALACGTPVTTFNAGGSPECVDKTCGSVVKINDIDGLESEIVRICKEHPYHQESCYKRSKFFDMNNWFQEYVRVYESR